MSFSTPSRLDRLAAIFESSQDAIISNDVDGVITEWNRGAEQLYGYSADEAIGKPITILLPPDHSDEFAEIMQQMRHGESVSHYETVRQRKDGGGVDVSLSVSPLRDEAERLLGRQPSPVTSARANAKKVLYEKAKSGFA